MNKIKNPLLQLKVILWFISIFHLVSGFGLMFSLDFQRFAISSYGGMVELNTASVYFIRIIGSFAFVLGYFAWMAARDPLRNKFVIIGFIEFFILRNICRHLFADELYATFKVSPSINVLTSVFFGVQALLLFFLLIRAHRSDTSGCNAKEGV